MLPKMRIGSSLILVLAIGSLLIPWSERPAGQATASDKSEQQAAHPDWSKWKYENSSQCSNCHTQPTNARIEQGALDLVLLSEAAIWRTYDKHAQAYAVLEGERGKKMAHLLGLQDTDILKPEAGCLSCHAMYNPGKENESQPGSGGFGLALEDGVSCGGCHGPSSGWNGPHANKEEWRNKSPQEKFAMGMRDLRDPEQRATVCVSCHIGNPVEGKVVTHAMFAAGHPPLPSFEIVNFSRNEPQHWRNPIDVPYFRTDKKEIIDNYHLKNKQFFNVQFSLIGTVVAFRENMKLAYDRANPTPTHPAIVWPELLLGENGFLDVKPEELKTEFPGRWPELAMAHSDCFACHHDLKYPGFRQERGFGYCVPGQELIRVTPGRPVVRSWSLAPLAIACNFVGKKELLAELDKLLRNLAAACNERPFGKPEDVRAATGALIDWSNRLIADLRMAEYSKESVRGLLLNLANSFQTQPDGSMSCVPDYETARLIVSMMRVVYGDFARSMGPGWRARRAIDTRETLDKLIAELNLEPYTGRDARLTTILNMIEESTRRKGDDKVDPRIHENIAKFQAYLKDIRDDEGLKSLVDNDFLDYLNRKYTSKMFVQGIIQPKIVNRLQEIGDNEEKGTLKAVSEYNPDVVLPLLHQFSEIVVRP